MLKTHALTKKKALAIVLLIGLVLLVLIGLRWYTARSPRCDLSTLEGRQAFLLELGWEIDPDSEEFRTVVVPEKLEGIMSQYNSALNQLGVTAIEAVGQPFDANRHNAVMHIEDDAYGEGVVVEEFEKGFCIGDRVLRYSVVKVAN